MVEMTLTSDRSKYNQIKSIMCNHILSYRHTTVKQSQLFAYKSSGEQDRECMMSLISGNSTEERHHFH